MKLHCSARGLSLAATLLLFACGQRPDPKAAPNTEIEELRALDNKVLDSYDVISKDAGTYQVPVEKAIEMVAADPKLLDPLVELPDPDEMSPLERGRYLFENTYGCSGCHALNNTVKRAPWLNGRWRGPPSEITTGQKIPFDDAYFNESVLNSQAKIVKGFQPIMPIFGGRMPERDLNDLRTYLKSL